MSDQLARKSVKTYRFAPEGFETVRTRLRLIQNITFIGTLGLFIAMDFKSADRHWLQGSLLSLLPHVFALTFVSALFFYSFHRALKKQRETWVSFELMVGEDFVIRRMTGLSEMEIRREEVTAIKRNAQGLIIETKSKQRTLAVPSTLEEFDEARARLSEWMTPTEIQRTRWKNSPYALYGIVVAEMCLFGVFFLSTRSWLLVCSGIPLFGGLVWCLVLLQRSAQLAPRMKRRMWFVFLPLTGIAIRLIDAILNWR